jgi:hypothetical protein
MQKKQCHFGDSELLDLPIANAHAVQMSGSHIITRGNTATEQHTTKTEGCKRPVVEAQLPVFGFKCANHLPVQF